MSENFNIFIKYHVTLQHEISVAFKAMSMCAKFAIVLAWLTDIIVEDIYDILVDVQGI